MVSNLQNLPNRCQQICLRFPTMSIIKTKVISHILSPQERVAYDAWLAECAKHGVEVFPKVKISDLLEVRGTNISNQFFDYATRAHFDLVLCANNFPILAVEVDGRQNISTFKNRRRFLRKVRLCKEWGLPLVRLPLSQLSLSMIFEVNRIIAEDYFEQSSKANALSLLEDKVRDLLKDDGLRKSFQRVQVSVRNSPCIAGLFTSKASDEGDATRAFNAVCYVPPTVPLLPERIARIASQIHHCEQHVQSIYSVGGSR